MRALAKDPDHRYASAAAFGEALRWSTSPHALTLAGWWGAAAGTTLAFRLGRPLLAALLFNVGFLLSIFPLLFLSGLYLAADALEERWGGPWELPGG